MWHNRNIPGIEACRFGYVKLKCEICMSSAAACFQLRHRAYVPGEDTMLSDQPYRYLTVDEMKSLGDDSLPIDVTRDERIDSNRECMGKYVNFFLIFFLYIYNFFLKLWSPLDQSLQIYKHHLFHDQIAVP